MSKESKSMNLTSSFVRDYLTKQQYDDLQILIERGRYSISEAFIAVTRKPRRITATPPEMRK